MAADTEYEIDRFKQYRHLLQEAINFKIRTIFHRIEYNGLMRYKDFIRRLYVCGRHHNRAKYNRWNDTICPVFPFWK